MADSPLIDLQDSSGKPDGSQTETTAEPSSSDEQLLGQSDAAKATAEGNPKAGPTRKTVTDTAGDEKTKRSSGISWPWSKRDRLKRDPSMDKVEDDDDGGDQGGGGQSKDDKGGSSVGSRCPDYFGVRSYLHHFYETRAAFKDPDVYYDDEADDTRRLLNPSSRRRRHCTAAWWKGFVGVGVLFLLAGIVCVLIGYLLPQKPIVVGMVGSDKEIVDREAIIYNYNLDACKLVGLILFCLGGLTLAVALMIPSFLYRYCDDEPPEVMFPVSVGQEAPPLLQKAAKDPLLMAVPTTEATEIQPGRKHDESTLARE